MGVTVLAWMIAALFVAGPVHAQAATPTPRATPRATATVTATAKIAPTSVPLSTSTPEAPLTGTIIANRTQVSVTFFLDGRTYEVAPLRSLSVLVRRDNIVLNLYNCEAQTGGENTACFWDPYLVREDGFYEVIDRAATGGPVSLFLQDAAAPPGDQIWLHNRTGQAIFVHYSGATYRLSVGSTVEVPLVDGGRTIYVDHCLELSGKSVCEWLPTPVNGGVYYAVTRSEQSGEASNSRRLATQLSPVLAQDASLLVEGEAQTSAAQVSAPSTVACSLAVPTLNVRAGPGVKFLIVQKLRQSDLGEDLVPIIGRSSDGGWLAVGDEIVADGWVSGGSRFVTCAGAVADLPVAAIADGRLEPTAVPQAGQPQAQPQPDPAAQPQPESQPAPQPSGPLPGQVRLVVNNAFGQEIRFTFKDTEYDMPLGGQVIIDTFPGQIAFSVSSAWRNMKGSADFIMLADETRVLFVRWEQDPDSGDWDMKYD